MRVTERTFVMIKPDGIERRLVGEIIGRLERKGLRLVGIKMVQPSIELAERHYAVHKGKSFYEPLLKFITSGPVVAMVWEGPDAIDLVRLLMGATRPQEALPGTIRGDFATDVQCNLVHGSDSTQTAATEIAIWFAPEELLF